MKRSDKNDPRGTDKQTESRFQSFLYYFDIFYRVVKALIILFIVILVVGGSLGAGTAIGYFASLVHDTEVPDQEVMAEQINNYNEKSTMYYAGGEIISDLRSDLLRTPVTLDEISPLLVNALVATEDEYFFDHEGIVPKAVARALVQDLTESGSSGGSTLTQQLIKQQLIGGEVSHERKANEILLALHLENHMEKDEILESYLNVSPFGRNNKGQNIAGVEEAAQGIFGVKASEVTLPQAAFIAGLPQRPIVYSPYTQFGELKESHSLGIQRQREVLFRMYREEYITLEEYEEAENYDLTQDFINREELDEDGLSYVYDLAEIEAKSILIKAYYEQDGITQEMLDEDPDLAGKYYERADYNIRNNGYQIHTTIDRTIHNAIEQTVADNRDFLGFEQTITYQNESGETLTDTYPVQIGGALIDNTTGRVYGFIGGRGYEESQWNNAFQTRRSPGSVMKPLAAYGPALAEGVITPATIIPDTEYAVPNWNDAIGGFENFYPSNYGATTNRWMPAREALYLSLNIPTYRLYMELKDTHDPGKYIRRMGLGPEAIKDSEFNNASFAIGGTDGGPTPVELTSAFSSIANNGVHVDPFVIERIENSAGEVVYEHESVQTEVWNPQANYLLLDMLRDVQTLGTARDVRSQIGFNADWISKTGTTQAYTDVWYVASTPRVSFSTWIGYENQNATLRHDHGIHPSLRVRTVWARIVNAIHSANPEVFGVGQAFTRPEGIVSSSVVQETGMKPGTVIAPDGESIAYTNQTYSEIFAANNIPSTTVYDFAIQASTDEYNEFWSEYISSQEEEEEEEEESEDAEETPDDEEKADDNEAEEPADEPAEPSTDEDETPPEDDASDE